MGKYDNMGFSQDEIKELERLDAEEILLAKRNHVKKLREEQTIEKSVVIKAKKSKNGYQLLGLLFGPLGIHDVYVGYYKLALLYFIFSAISLLTYPVFIIVIWGIAILEIVLSVKDANGNRLE